MKGFIKTLFLAALAGIAMTACGDDKDKTEAPAKKPGGDKVIFQTIDEAVYRGGSAGDAFGKYLLTLRAEGHELHFVFYSSLDDSGTPMPDEGEYLFAAEAAKGTFDAESYWLSEENGTQTNRSLATGSFTLSQSTDGFKIEGAVAGRDGATIDFGYDGPLAFVDFNGDPAPGAIECLKGHGTYYGNYYVPDSWNYYIVLFDTKHLAEGDPYNYRIALDISSVRPTGGNIMLPFGTYRIDTEGTFPAGTLIAGMWNGANGTYWQIPDGEGSIHYMVTDGFFTFRKADNGQYQVFGTLKDNYGKEISFNYVGPLSFDNSAVGTFTSLTQDFTLEDIFYSQQKCYATTDDFNFWKVYFYDEPNWTTQGKEGYMIVFDLTLPTDCKYIPSGEYTVAEYVMIPEMNTFVSGYIFAYDTSLAKSSGSWLAKSDGQNAMPYAPLRGGSLKMTRNADGTYSASFDCTDDGFITNHVRGSFTGEIPVSADSEVHKLGVPAAKRRIR